MHRMFISGVLAALLASSAVAYPLPALIQSRDNSKTAVSCISCHGLTGHTDPSGWSQDLPDRNFAKSSPDKRSASPDFEWHAPTADDDDDGASLEDRGTNWDNAPFEKRSASPETDWHVSPADNDDASLEGRGSTSWDNAPIEKRSASSENDWHVSPADDDASLEGRGTALNKAPVKKRSASPDIDWQVSPVDDDPNLENRGTNWDNAPMEQRSASPEVDWNVSPADEDASLEGRGTNWDNTPIEGKRDALGLSGVGPRGTNWDGTHGEDKRNALGPKVGQGGKPTPLYGNGWELGRRARRLLDTKPSKFVSRSLLAERLALENRNADAADDSESVLPASSFYPSGSWKGQNRREARTDATVTPFVRRTEDKQDGKPMPASSCSSCMVKKLVKRWVSSPYVSSSDSSGDSVNAISKEPRSMEEKVRVTRTEDSKGSVGKDGTEPVPDGGVPMPLSVAHWARRVKKCVSQGKESGWNHRCL